MQDDFGIKSFLLKQPSTTQQRYARFLSILYATILFAATVLAYKIIRITDHIAMPASTLVFTSSYFVAMMIAELYGPYLARRIIYEVLICGYVFAIILTLILRLPSPSFWMNEQAYSSILGHVLRFTLAGSVGFLLSNFLAVFFLQKWRILLKGKWFSLRSLGATSCGEIIATYMVGIITFWHMMPIKKILMIMTAALIYKLIINSVIVWPTSFFVVLIKRLENRAQSKAENSSSLGQLSQR